MTNYVKLKKVTADNWEAVVELELSAYARSMGVSLNGYTNSPRMPKSFYTTHSSYYKAYRAARKVIILCNYRT